MPNKIKVLVVGKKLGKSSAYKIAGTVASECGKCQADVDVTFISDKELKFLCVGATTGHALGSTSGWRPGGCSCKVCESIRSLIEKLKPEPE